MNRRQKILMIENRIIDKLTALTWWTEVEYQKSNLDLAVFAYYLGTLLTSLAFGYIGLVCYQLTSSILSIPLILIAVILFFGSVFGLHNSKIDQIKKRIARDFPQGCPNPSRYLKRSSAKRLASIIWGLMIGLLFAVNGSLFFGFLTWAIFAFGLSFFFLSCDALPPQEKARRRAKREMKNFATHASGV